MCPFYHVCVQAEFFQQFVHPFHCASMVWATVNVKNFDLHSGEPKPAARRVASSGPRSAQQPASFPSMTTAGTLRTPRCFARSATSRCFISSTAISHEGHAILFTSLIVSSQQPHPALKISTFLLLFIVHVLF